MSSFRSLYIHCASKYIMTKRDKNAARLKFTLINAILLISQAVVEMYQVQLFKYCVTVQF